jgi:hypothetical protein
MDSLKKMTKVMTKGMKQNDYVLIGLMIAYIIFNVQTPKTISELLVNNTIAKVVLYLPGLYYLFSVGNAKQMIGVLALITAFLITKRASQSTGTADMIKYLPSEDKKMDAISALNQFPKTLEEEIVTTMTPPIQDMVAEGEPTYLPILDDAGASMSVDDDGRLI